MEVRPKLNGSLSSQRSRDALWYVHPDAGSQTPTSSQNRLELKFLISMESCLTAAVKFQQTAVIDRLTEENQRLKQKLRYRERKANGEQPAAGIKLVLDALARGDPALDLLGLLYPALSPAK